MNNEDSTALCARRLDACLKAGPNRVAIFEEPHSTPQDGWVQTYSDWPLMFQGEQVYFYVAGSASTPQKVEWTLHHAGGAYPPPMAVVAEAPKDLDAILQTNPVTIEPDFLVHIASNVLMISVSAYDAESYLLWEVKPG